MDLSEDLNFLAAAITAITGDYIFAIKIRSPDPSSNTQTRSRSPQPEWVWNEEKTDICDLSSFRDRTITWYYPPPDTREKGLLSIRYITGDKIKLSVDSSSSVLSLKEKIRDMEGKPIHTFRLIFGGKKLCDEKRLCDYDIARDDTIQLLREPASIMASQTPTAALLDKSLFDFKYNFDLTWLQDNGKMFKRGSEVYKRPYGWNRIAFNLGNNFDDLEWMNGDGDAAEEDWPVTYQGKKDVLFETLKDEEFDQGASCGLVRGIYSSPDPCVAEEWAPGFTYMEREFKVMIQSRVNMRDTRRVQGGKYFATDQAESIRPYGILIKRID